MVLAIRLLVLTGARRAEIVHARWDYVDFDRGFLNLPDSKSGAKALPLGAPVLELLQDAPRHADNPFICAGQRAEAPIGGLQKAWARIRNRADLQGVRIHDLRHSFASVAVAGGQSLHVIGKMLGHSRPGTTARYAHLADDPLRMAANRTAGQIAASMKAGKSSGDIVKLSNRKP